MVKVSLKVNISMNISKKKNTPKNHPLNPEIPRTLISFDFQLDHYISSRETKGIPSVLKAVLSFPCIRLNKHNKINKHKYLLYTPPNCGSISYIPHCDIPF